MPMPVRSLTPLIGVAVSNDSELSKDSPSPTMPTSAPTVLTVVESLGSIIEIPMKVEFYANIYGVGSNGAITEKFDLKLPYNPKSPHSCYFQLGEMFQAWLKQFTEKPYASGWRTLA